MYGQRVLIVEDLPDWRKTLSGLLSDEGYIVRSVAGRAEALQLLKTERFHVAVLDARLDDSDETNIEGLALMHQIRDLYPTTVVIMLTGYATVEMVQQALQPDRDGNRLAYGFLQKTETEKLLETLESAFQSEVRLNPALVIHDPDQLLPRLQKRLRFGKSVEPPPQRLVEEIDDLLRKLFFDCTEITIRSLERGYSGAAVIQIDPVYQDRGPGGTVIAKLGERSLVQTESDRYKHLVSGLVGGNRIPTSLETSYTRSLGGIVYTFAGLGETTGLVTFYESAGTNEVLDAIARLFEQTCFPWQCEASAAEKDHNLTEWYMDLLNLDKEKLETRLESGIGSQPPFYMVGDGDQIGLGDQCVLPNPVRYVLSAPLIDDSSTSIIHGDLNAHNVLIDKNRDAWLIDFARVTRGPVLHDYATFESFLRLCLLENEDWRLLYQWDRALFATPNFWTPELPPELDPLLDFVKAHHAVIKIHALIVKRHRRKVERRYLIALLFNTLKIGTMLSFPAIQRQHALISAAMIVERLRQADLRHG